MKKRLAAVFVVLSLACGLAVPAWAAEGADWRKTEEEFTAEYVARWQEEHPEEWAAFDADAWYHKEYNAMEKETFLELYELDEEAFRVEMWKEEREEEITRAYDRYVTGAYEAAFPGNIDEVGIPWAVMVFGWESLEVFAAETSEGDMEAARLYLASAYVRGRQGVAYNHEESLKYREQYPGSWEGFDPDKGYEGYWAYMKQNNMARYGLQNEVEWKEYGYVRYMEGGQYAYEQEQAAKREEYPGRWP